MVVSAACFVCNFMAKWWEEMRENSISKQYGIHLVYSFFHRGQLKNSRQPEWLNWTMLPGTANVHAPKERHDEKKLYVMLNIRRFIEFTIMSKNSWKQSLKYRFRRWGSMMFFEKKKRVLKIPNLLFDRTILFNEDAKKSSAISTVATAKWWVTYINVQKYHRFDALLPICKC